MKLLILGAGGVGSAAARIAARRPFLEQVVRRRLRPRPGASGPRRPPATRGSPRPRSTPATRRAVARLLADDRGRRGARRDRSAVHHADLPRRAGRRRALPGHGDVAVPAAPGPSRTSRPASSSATSSSRWPSSGRRPAGSRWSASASSPGLSDVFARYAADHLFSEIDELGVRDGANLEVGRRLRVRAVLLDLDHDRGVPEPAGDLREGPRLVHHRAVQRTGGLRLPRGHRPGRVRQRRARGSAADAALGRRQAGHLQVRPGRRVHRRAARRCTSSAWTARRRCGSAAVEVSARATWSPPACPTRPTLGDRMSGKTCAGLWVRGTGKDGQPRSTLPLPRGGQRVVDGRVRLAGGGLADRGQPGRRAGTDRRRACWTGAGVLGPEAFDAVPFLDLLAGDYDSPWGIKELRAGPRRHVTSVR